MWAATRTKNPNTKKFAATNQPHPSLYSNTSLNSDLLRWFSRILVYHLLRILAFGISTYSLPNTVSPNLIARHVASRTNLDLVTLAYYLLHGILSTFLVNCKFEREGIIIVLLFIISLVKITVVSGLEKALNKYSLNK